MKLLWIRELLIGLTRNSSSFTDLLNTVINSSAKLRSSPQSSSNLLFKNIILNHINNNFYLFYREYFDITYSGLRREDSQRLIQQWYNNKNPKSRPPIFFFPLFWQFWNHFLALISLRCEIKYTLHTYLTYHSSVILLKKEIRLYCFSLASTTYRIRCGSKLSVFSYSSST